MTASSRWSTLVILVCAVTLINGGFLVYKLTLFRVQLLNYPDIFHFACMRGHAARYFIGGYLCAEIIGMAGLLLSTCGKNKCFALLAAVIFGIIPVIAVIDMSWKAERYFSVIFQGDWGTAMPCSRVLWQSPGGGEGFPGS